MLEHLTHNRLLEPPLLKVREYTFAHQRGVKKIRLNRSGKPWLIVAAGGADWRAGAGRGGGLVGRGGGLVWRGGGVGSQWATGKGSGILNIC